MADLTFTVKVRDPIYGFIGLTNKEVALINTPVFQRLRRIKQLGNAHLVYPSACHTRFEHSLGVLHVAYLMAKKLKLTTRETEIIRYAALLHDIGHGPLSHNFEAIIKEINRNSIPADIKLDHEYIGCRIIEENYDIERILREDKNEVLKLLKDDDEVEDVNRQIIDSMLDADKLDYLRRDSYHAGVSYGLFDFDRILNTLVKRKDGNRYFLKIEEKGVDAFNNYRTARYLMYNQVYFHHVKLVSEKMFERAIKYAIAEDTEYKNIPSLKINDYNFLSNYLSLDDENIFRKILESNPYGKSYYLMSSVVERRLFKRGFEASQVDILDDTTRARIALFKESDLEKIESKLSEYCNCDKDLIIAYRQSISNPLFKSTYDMLSGNEAPLEIITNNGNTRSLDQYWPFIQRGEPSYRFYVFCQDDHICDIGKNTQKAIKDIITA